MTRLKKHTKYTTEELPTEFADRVREIVEDSTKLGKCLICLVKFRF